MRTALLAVFLVSMPLTAQPAPVPPTAPVADPLENTSWLGTITSPTGAAAFGLAFRRSPKGVFYAVGYAPMMHVYRRPVSAVERHGEEVVIGELQARLRQSGDTLAGTALFADMPVELRRIEALPAETEPSPPAFPAGPEPRWVRQLGAAAWGSPAVRDGVVYLGTADGRFHALRARDGAEVWTWAGAVPLYGAPLVTADATFFVDDRGALVRLDRARGTLAWRVPLDAARSAAAAIPDDDTYSHRTAVPVLAGDTLYVGATDGTVFALAAASGAVRWRTPGDAKICSAVAVDGDRVLVGDLGGTLRALARADGHELWRAKVDAAIVSAPVVAGGRAFVGSRDFQLRAFDPASGKEAWRQHFWFSWIESEPRVVDGVLYVGSSDLRAVRALDAASGRPLWSTDVYGSAWAAPAVGADTVYMGVVGVRDYLIRHLPSIVALDRRTGAIRWRRGEEPPAEAPMSGHPGALTVAGELLLASGLDGTLLAIPTR